MIKAPVCLIFSAALLCSNAFASQIGYATDNLGNLYTVNLTTATATLIGNAGALFLEGLAVSPGGTLYGTDSTGELYSISTTTAATTAIGSTGQGDIEGLDFNGATLVGTNFTNVGTPTSIFSINTGTAATTGLTTATNIRVTAMAVYDSNDAYVISEGTQALSTVNLTTGAKTTIGVLPLSGGQEIAAMDVGTDGVLYALDNQGNDYTVNTSTGALTLIGNTGSHFFLDLTIQSPEPGTWLLFAGAGLVFVAMGRRKLRS